MVNLAHWYVTLPTAENIRNPQLSSLSNEFFGFNAVGELRLFAPVLGTAVNNSHYARCELRETHESNALRNWNPFVGTHKMQASLYFTRLPDLQKITIGQVHTKTLVPGKTVPFPPLVLSLRGTQVRLSYQSELGGAITYKVLASGIGLKTRINYSISVSQGVAAVDVNGVKAKVQFGASYRNAEFYFKSGVYVQQNVGREDEAAEAFFVDLLTSHA
jgi:hypothetical protein